jgi:hypothetical protein
LPVSSAEHRDERGHAAALLERAPHEVTRALRRDHPHVDALGRADLAEVDVEAVRERERVALFEVRLDVLLVDAEACSLSEASTMITSASLHASAVVRRGGRPLRPCPRRRALRRPDANVDAGVLQGSGVGVACEP